MFRFVLPTVLPTLAALLALSLPPLTFAQSADNADPKNLAAGSAYRVTASFPDSSLVKEETRYPDTNGTELTDGVRAAPGAPYTDPAWQGWALQDRRIVTLDLQKPSRIRAVTLHLGLEPSLAIHLPENITVAVSEDGERWSPPVRLSPAAPEPVPGPSAIRARPVTVTLPAAPTARYVQIQADIRRWVFAEEIEILGTPAVPDAGKKPQRGTLLLDRIVRERRGLLKQAKMAGWLPPGGAASGGARHISLMYVSGAAKEGLGTNHYLPYTAYRDREGTIRDTLFDTFLFLPSVRTATGRSFAGAVNPAHLEDWMRFMDQLFQPDFQLAALDKAAARTASALKRPLREKVILAIPFPAPKLSGFGTLPGTTAPLDFDETPEGREKRLAAVFWFRDELLRRWKRAGFENLDLIGFYWFAEEVAAADRTLVRAFADRVHRDPAYRFFWIPYFQASGIREWKEMGFDAAMLQPNLAFSDIAPEKSAERLQSAANLAAQYGLGLEIELHWTLADPAHRARYLAYLEWGDKLGYRDRALLSYYQSVASFREAADSSDPEIRRLYDATYDFIKGSRGRGSGNGGKAER